MAKMHFVDLQAFFSEEVPKGHILEVSKRQVLSPAESISKIVFVPAPAMEDMIGSLTVNTLRKIRDLTGSKKAINESFCYIKLTFL